MIANMALLKGGIYIYFPGIAFDYNCAVYLLLLVRNLKQSETAAQSIQSIRSLCRI